MKIITMMMSMMILLAPLSFAQSAKEVGKKLITAYKKKDAQTIKKHMAPIMALTVNAKFFKGKDIKADIKNLEKWNGKIREVRYFATRFGAMAVLHYDADNDENKIRVFILNKFRKTWKEGIGGFDTMEKSRFLSLSKKEVAKKPRKKKKRKTGSKATNKGYSIEMAEGGIIKNPSINKLKKSLASLSEDNFFLTLNGPKGFMQGSFSEKGMDMQYKAGKGHFTCADLVDDKTAESMFFGYIKNKSGWKNKCEWKPFE